MSEEIPKPKVIIIAAIGKNFELGKDNTLLWHLHEDMRFFKETTLGHTVVTGRKSFESIPPKYRPLPERTNIILSRNPDYMYEECYTVTSLDEAMDIALSQGEIKVFIIGGGEIYKLALDHDFVDEMYLTHVDASFADADTFFPQFNSELWEAEQIMAIASDSMNEYPFVVKHYKRKTIQVIKPYPTEAVNPSNP